MVLVMLMTLHQPMVVVQRELQVGYPNIKTLTHRVHFLTLIPLCSWPSSLPSPCKTLPFPLNLYILDISKHILLVNSEDPDKMPHKGALCGISLESALFVKMKTISVSEIHYFKEKGTYICAHEWIFFKHCIF